MSDPGTLMVPLLALDILKGGITMTRAISILVGLLMFVGGVQAREKVNVRVVTSASEVERCELVGAVRDDDLEDLLEKAAKKGGSHVLMVGQSTKFDFPFPPKMVMNAQVYRCMP
jgi:hypothetical protein